MSKIDKKKLGKLKKEVGFDEEPEHQRKRVKIINDNVQFRIRIPKKFAEVLKIDAEKDEFEFHMIPDEEREFKLEGRLIRNEEE